jgi:hypothetical protein
LKPQEAARMGLFGNGGLIVGKRGRRLLRFADVEGSVIMFAPQGIPQNGTGGAATLCRSPPD